MIVIVDFDCLLVLVGFLDRCVCFECLVFSWFVLLKFVNLDGLYD